MIYAFVTGGAVVMIALLVWMAKESGRDEEQLDNAIKENDGLRKVISARGKLNSDRDYAAKLRKRFTRD